MKKMTFLLIIILLLPYISVNKKSHNVFKSNYDIIYKEGEVGITFILENNINALLINDNDNNNDLVILDYKNIKDLEIEFKKFNIPKINNIYNITPVIINLFGKTSKTLIPDKNDIIKFNYNNKDFCIFVSNSDIERKLNCDFIYMYKFSNTSKVSFGNNISLVFQNNNNRLPTKIQETLYENWIDTYTITHYEYATLKLLKDGFDTIIVPILK